MSEPVAIDKWIYSLFKIICQQEELLEALALSVFSVTEAAKEKIPGFEESLHCHAQQAQKIESFQSTASRVKLLKEQLEQLRASLGT